MNRLTLLFLVVWPWFLNDFYVIEIDNQSLALLWSLDVVFVVLYPLVAIYLLQRVGLLSISEYWPSQPQRVRSIAVGTALFIWSIVVIRYLIDPIIYDLLPQTTYAYGFPESGWPRILLVLWAAISTGFVEELVFRGFVTNEMSRRFTSPIAALVVSCALFGAAHWYQGPAGILTATIWAIVPTLWYLKSRDLLSLIVCHSLYDLVLFLGWA